MKLLLISNSTNAGEQYLEHPKEQIRSFLGSKPVKALFIPYAGVMVSYDDFAGKVNMKFLEAGHSIVSIHTFSDPVKAVMDAEALVTGGGNTFQLIKLLHEYGLVAPIKQKVLSGTPYIGWSAGANIACPTMRTTNDMPIVQPASFNALDLVPFQINPHYLDANPEGHAGETREQRIEEFIELNRNVTVAGLREGTMLLIEDQAVQLIGKKAVRLFRYGSRPEEVCAGNDISYLLRRF